MENINVLIINAVEPTQLLIPTKSIHYLGNMYWED